MPWLNEADFVPGFSDRARAEGKKLFDERKVQWLEGSGGTRYEARLPFFRRFQTAWIEKADGGPVEADCTCPELENTGTRCAHIYAVMLAANHRRLEDQREALGDAPVAPYYALSLDKKALGLSLLWTGDDPDDPALRLLPLDGDHLARVSGALDREVLAVLQPIAGGKRSLIEGGGFQRQTQPVPLPAERREELLDRCAKTGRLVYAAKEGAPARALQPVQLDLRTKLGFAIAFHEHEDGRLRLRGELRGPDGPIPLDGRIAVVADLAPIARIGHRLVSVEAQGAANWLALFATAPDFKAREDEVEATLQRLATQGALPRVRLPRESTPLPLVQRPPIPRLVITRRRMDIQAEVDFRYGERIIKPESGERLFLDLARKEQVTRDLKAEADTLRLLAERPGLIRDREGLLGRFEVDAESLESLTAELLEEGFEVSVDRRALVAARRTKVEIVSQGFDWFDLHGGLEFDSGEIVPFERLLDAERAGERFIALRDGKEGLVPRALAERLARLARMSSEDGHPLRLSRAQALLLEPLLGETDDAGLDLADLRAQRERLLGFGQSSGEPAARGFEGTLRPYQEAGLGWLRGLASARLGGILADDMGLGKTIQVLAFLHSLIERPIDGLDAATPHLIVAPRSLLWNWQAELRRFAPTLTAWLHHGPGRVTDAATFPAGSVVLTSYGTLQRDQAMFARASFQTCILDEAQAIKNPDSLSAIAVKSIRAGFRLSVTGTPIENRARDLWSQLDFLNPGLLGSSKRFADLVAGRDARLRDAVLKSVRPLILRRTKAEVAPELPERIEQTVPVGLADEQAKLYGQVRETARARLQGGDLNTQRFHVLEALLRLRQVACHPGLVDPALKDAPSAKLDLLVDELEAIAEAGEKALVFSQFVSLLDIVSKNLKSKDLPHLILTGETKDRAAVVQAFQSDPQTPVLLISLKAGGTGLNLTAADYVFILDPWWNPAVEAQAIDRAHRIGRTRRVIARRLVAQGTVEERILELQAKKRALADALLSGDQGPLASLTAEDLEHLLAI